MKTGSVVESFEQQQQNHRASVHTVAVTTASSASGGVSATFRIQFWSQQVCGGVTAVFFFCCSVSRDRPSVSRVGRVRAGRLRVRVIGKVGRVRVGRVGRVRVTAITAIQFKEADGRV